MQHILSNEDNSLCVCCLNGHRYCCGGMTATQAAGVSGYGKSVVEPMYIVDHILALSTEVTRGR